MKKLFITILLAISMYAPLQANADWVLYVKDMPIKVYKDYGQCKSEAWLLNYILDAKCEYSMAYNK